jgi:hypothetical protein
MSPPVTASPPVTVSPSALRQGSDALRATAAEVAGDLTGTYHAAAPARSVNLEWAVTAAVGELVSSLDAALQHVVGRIRDAADRLEQAAAEYEQADERATGRLRW